MSKLMLKQKRLWLPWVLAAAAILTAALLGRAALSARERQRDMEAELQLQRETIEALRAEASQTEEEGLIHPGVPVITNSMVSDQLSAMQELVTTEYIYTNSGKYENQNQATIIGQNINIPFTSKRFIVAYDGRIKVGLELSKAKIEVNEASRTITITLPDCEIISHETFEDTLVVLDETNNVFNPISISDYNDFVGGQKAIMEQKAIDRGVFTNAEDGAKQLIQSFLSLMPGMDSYKLVIL